MTTDTLAPVSVTSAAVTSAHWYSWQSIKADFAELERILGFASQYAPEAAVAADIVEVAVGAGGLVPATNLAAAGLQSMTAADVAAHSGNVSAVLQGIQATVSAAKTIAAGTVAAVPASAPATAPPAAP